MVHSQVTQTTAFLEQTVEKVGNYLNETTLQSLLNENKEGDPAYFERLVSNLRRMFVFCEEGLDACKVVLNGDKFRKGAAEKALYWVYHQCVAEFYSPRHDGWYEDSRSAYTGKNAIKFTSDAPESIKVLIASLENSFQEIREELEYYETDYKTKMIQSK
ncbi:hypothetical protein BFG57_00655 [Bacillus solimangrovi]|uniref:DUF3907 domain-containing protein n=1 Tax=Bacillus solimangrovi TaxID=1305675 RepID=A0A1E5LHU1_9BACI|nr:hypothetical protein BFG57_00655 [Bacillus solimangrovi]